MSRADVEVGSTANTYEILAKLAEGGMAEIFLARGASTAGIERHVVLKRVLRERATDANLIRMFLDEARLAAQLQHPNIAQVYDIGKLGDSYFFTMEYVHGETVRALTQRAAGVRRPIPLNCILIVASGAAAGLHHAHERTGIDGKHLGIVHRDVSPSNLMVSYEGNVKLVDFGVAKAADRLQETRSGTVKGKISYLSPEQCVGDPVDRRSDLFALGIVLWEMLVGERLFRRNSDFETMTAIVKDPVVPPSKLRSEIPRALDEIILRLLARAPDERFQTAEQVLEALEIVAGQTNSVLAAGSLGRFLRDLFGHRPEPWIEVAHQQDKPITVTSEPIPLQLTAEASDVVENQLAAVTNLAVQIPAGARPSSQPGVLVGSISASGATPPRGLPSGSVPPTNNVIPMTPSLGRTVPGAPILGEPTTAGMGVAPPHVGEATAQISIRKRGRPGLWIGGASVAVAVAIVIVLAATGKEPKPAASPTPTAQVEPKAQPTELPPAAAEPSQPTPPAPNHEPSPTPPPTSADPPTPAQPIGEAVRAQHFDTALAACIAASAGELAKNQPDCAIAACRMRDVKHARQWYLSSVPAGRRAAVSAACQATRVMLEVGRPMPRGGGRPDGKPKIDCMKQPLDCPR